MDQDAFRSFLAAPPKNGESSTLSRKALGGGAAPKRGWGLKPKDGKSYETAQAPEPPKAQFAPRATHKKIMKEGGYKDRADMRRKGVDDEFKQVERLLDDFEKKAVEEGVDEEEIAKQRAYLGGDAEHSILVKGLDYALLAARKAELAKEQEGVADEELDNILTGITSDRAGDRRQKEAAAAEKLGKGFKAIGKIQPTEEKKKKKKKKKKSLREPETVAPRISNEQLSNATTISTQAVVQYPDAPRPFKDDSNPQKPEAQDTMDDVEDIFADAGEYDLHANDPSEDSDSSAGAGPTREKSLHVRNSHGKEGTPNGKSISRRYRSGSSEDEYRGKPSSRRYSPVRRPRSRSRSRSRDHRGYRSHSQDWERNDRERRDRDFSRTEYRNGNDYARNGDYDRNGRHDEGRSYRYREERFGNDGKAEREGRYRDHDDRSERRRRYSSDYSRSPQRDEKRRRQYSRSRSPYRPRTSARQFNGAERRSDDHRGSRSRTPPKPHLRWPNERSDTSSPPPPPPPPPQRRRSRSITPPIFNNYGPPLSRSPSPASSIEGAIPTKLQPLQSSAISDVKSFLSYEAAQSKAEDKRLKKAQWKAKQGLGLPEGVDADNLKRKDNDKQRANADYVKVMNYVDKKETGGAKAE